MRNFQEDGFNGRNDQKLCEEDENYYDSNGGHRANLPDSPVLR